MKNLTDAVMIMGSEFPREYGYWDANPETEVWSSYKDFSSYFKCYEACSRDEAMGYLKAYPVNWLELSCTLPVAPTNILKITSFPLLDQLFP